MNLTLERLRYLLTYEPDTGIFRWNISRGNQKAGSVAGHKAESDGYVRIKLDGNLHFAHRLAVFYMTERWPPDQVDHKDLCQSHNWWDNLRLANNSQNNANQTARITNASGVKGVAYYPGRKSPFVVQGKREGKTFYLGSFSEIEEAAALAADYADKTYKEFARR